MVTKAKKERQEVLQHGNNAQLILGLTTLADAMRHISNWMDSQLEVLKPEDKKPKAKRAKRLPGAYNLFVQAIRPEVVKDTTGLAATEVLSECARRWKLLSDAQKKPFEDQAAALKDARDKGIGAPATAAASTTAVAAGAKKRGRPKKEAAKKPKTDHLPSTAVAPPVATPVPTKKFPEQTSSTPTPKAKKPAANNTSTPTGILKKNGTPAAAAAATPTANGASTPTPKRKLDGESSAVEGSAVEEQTPTAKGEKDKKKDKKKNKEGKA
ncbi:hypothetical protein HDV00_008210 [Rhizophlyctis rosea]|nr:hypothetical protein HDV00_008210 [Rhizophlyctis rosea]